MLSPRPKAFDIMNMRASLRCLRVPNRPLVRLMAGSRANACRLRVPVVDYWRNMPPRRWNFWEGLQLARRARTPLAFQKCILPRCGATYGIDEILVACKACGSLLDIGYDWSRLRPPTNWKFFEDKWSRRYEPLCFSGVWRFHELLPFAPPEKVVTIGEGQTLLQAAEQRGPATWASSPAACSCNTRG